MGIRSDNNSNNSSSISISCKTSMQDCFVSFRASRRALLVLIGGWLCFMKLSGDFYLHSQQYATIATNGLQQELMEASVLLAEETHKTASFLRGLSTPSENTADREQQGDAAAASGAVAGTAANTTNSPYAYAFVIGGCNPDRPVYKGFLYNILVSTRLLRQLGSTADVVVYFQLSHAYQRSDVLPDEDVRALQGLGIKIFYIERSEHESFYETVMNKFRILQLTQYRRVLLMDGDVMPVANLDYLFHLSDDNKFGPGNSTLRENVIVSGPWEPSNAGFFMLTPGEGDYERVQDIIHTRRDRASQQGVLFDEVEGWGHVIEEGDEWRSRRQSGRNWTFHFAFSDQGLLYHWTKYVKHSVSIVYQGEAENWSPSSAAGGEERAVLERVLDRPFVDYSKPLVKQAGPCLKFLCDYHHFSGVSKPWLKKPPTGLTDDNKLKGGSNIWWYFLRIVDYELQMGLDFDNWQTGQRPALGLYATYTDLGKHNKKMSAIAADQAEADAEKQFEEEQAEFEDDDNNNNNNNNSELLESE